MCVTKCLSLEVKSDGALKSICHEILELHLYEGLNEQSSRDACSFTGDGSTPPLAISFVFLDISPLNACVFGLFI